MNKPQIYSSLVTIVCGVLIALLLMFIYMPFNKEEEEEGVMISFGDGIEGLGEMPPLMATTTPPVTQDNLMTQDTEETVNLDAQKQEKEQKRIEAEQAEKTAKANQAASVFRQQISDVGKATDSGITRNPAGKGSSNGNSWLLDGRDLTGSLYKPSYNSNDEGKVVVSIRVNESGNVIDTSIAAGTTIADANLRKAAMDAAKKTKFSSGNNIAIGTITYNFKLN